VYEICLLVHHNDIGNRLFRRLFEHHLTLVGMHIHVHMLYHFDHTFTAHDALRHWFTGGELTGVCDRDVN